jgi:hypothetical protein
MKGYTDSMPLFAPKSAPVPVEPADPHVREQDRPRLSRNNLAVLRRLQQGPASTVELLAEKCGGIRPGARVFDLIEAGCQIKSDRVANGVALYTLLSAPEHL